MTKKTDKSSGKNTGSVGALDGGFVVEMPMFSEALGDIVKEGCFCATCRAALVFALATDLAKLADDKNQFAVSGVCFVAAASACVANDVAEKDFICMARTIYAMAEKDLGGQNAVN